MQDATKPSPTFFEIAVYIEFVDASSSDLDLQMIVVKAIIFCRVELSFIFNV